MICFLDNIENKVQDYANTISDILKVDVEITDNNMCRIAGTGNFQDDVYEIKTICIYEKAMESQEILIIENPIEDILCKNCIEKIDCNYKLLIVVPLIYREKAVGAIGVVSFSEEDRDRIINAMDSYLLFLKHMSELINKAIDKELSDGKNNNKDFIEEILLNIEKPGIIINKDNNLQFINNMAKTELNISNYDLENNIKINIKKVEENIYSLSFNEENYLIKGKKIYLNPMFEEDYTMIIFDKQEKEEIILDENPHGDRRVSIDAIVGNSPKMEELKRKIIKIGQTQSTVLISGASGTGKELVARAIHNCSSRKNKRFIAVNCSAIPESLIESELFGYTKGAFTGANPGGKVGKFELANHGVIFLDEIGDMPLDTQVKLLRILEERRVIPIGSNTPIDLDIRIIAATNIDLEEKIKNNEFREDLYYRLNVIPIEVPVLNDRKEDIELFIYDFLKKYNNLFDKYIHTIEEDCIEAMVNYNWPGNVRELQNTVEYLVNVSDDNGIITKDMLPDNILNIKKSIEEDILYTDNEIMPLDEMEIEYIKRALDICGKDTDGKKEAAEKLGIGIATLYRRIKEIEKISK